MEVVEYSEKSVAVFGDTKTYKEELKKLGGKFNNRLTRNENVEAGWIFSKKAEKDVRKFVSEHKLSSSVTTSRSETAKEAEKKEKTTYDKIVEMLPKLSEIEKQNLSRLLRPVFDSEKPKKVPLINQSESDSGSDSDDHDMPRKLFQR